MILQSAIAAYLERSVDDHRWIKDLRAAEVDQLIDSIEPRVALHYEARMHQRACFALGVAYPAFGFWLDMGTGKTLIALELMRYWWRTKKLRRGLVFVTSNAAFPTWAKQIERFKIEVPYVMLDGSSEQKWRQLASFDNGLVFVSYPGMVAMVCRKARKQLEVDPDKFERLADRVDALVLDESTRASGYKSLTHGLCRDLRERVDICYALAGRPFGRDPTLLWAQQKIIDKGESLGETLGLFREAFFIGKENYWAARKGRRGKFVKDYVFNKQRMPELTRLARHRSVTYSAEECIEVPQWTPLREHVQLPEEASLYYERTVNQIIDAKGNLKEMQSAFTRIRQLSSGFLGLRDEDDNDKRVEVAFGVNPKLDRLLELIEEMPTDRKALVFYEFTWSGRRIMEELTERKISASWLWGGTKDSQAALRRFTDSQDCNVMVLNNRKGAMSLDGLQVANYVFFYESPVSVIDREQAERRARRQGQMRKVFQYDLVVDGTLDERILAYHVEGSDLLKALRADPGKLLEMKK